MVALNCCIDEVSWEEIREEVSQVNSLLAKLVDQVEPDSSLKLFRVRYPFGAYIFQRNQIQFPLNSQKNVSISDHHLPKQIKDQLNYNTIPLAFLMNKKAEIFIENSEKIIPLNLVHPGEFIGLSELFTGSEKAILNYPSQITAGLRNVFFLSRIADGQSHRKLKSLYHIKHAAPKKLKEHWHVFRELIQSFYTECHWTCEVIFVSDMFIKTIRQHPNYLHLKNYLMQILLEQKKLWQNRAYIEVNWQILFSEMAVDNFKIVPNDIIAIRRLLDVAIGLTPGFRPAIDEVGLPLTTLQTIYLNDYELKEYAPIIMQADYLTPSLPFENPFYFSLLFPTHPYHKTITRQQSTLNELREIIQLNDAINQWLLKRNYFGFSNLSRLRYEYFHSDIDALHKIRSTQTILQFDNALAKQVRLYGSRKFPEKSPFLRGSVLIVKK